MIEIILTILTTVLTIIATFTSAIVASRTRCHSECCDIVMQTDPDDSYSE